MSLRVDSNSFQPLRVRNDKDIHCPKNNVVMIEINMNNIKRYLGSVSVYISLLTCGLLMTISAIDQYLERKTTFETQESPLTLEDLPVFTICYKRMNFQTDYVHGYCLPQILNQSFKVHGKVNEEFIDASIT